MIEAGFIGSAEARKLHAIAAEEADSYRTSSRLVTAKAAAAAEEAGEIGRAAGRARVCEYVYISVGAVSLQKQQREKEMTNREYSLCRVLLKLTIKIKRNVVY